MEIILAKSAGFCFGVARAVERIYDELNKREKGTQLCTYGPIAHNRFVTKDLEERGVQIIDSADQARGTVVIRSHGVSPQIYEELAAKNVEVIDCTCPCIKKIHTLTEKNRAQGRRIIIAGDEAHPEIVGIKGFAGDDAIVLRKAEQLMNISIPKTQKYALVAQTTFVRQDYEDIISALSDMQIDVEIFDTICGATVERQTEAMDIASRVDKMIVIGNKKSANTINLAELCQKRCKNTVLIESIGDLQLKSFSTNDRIGIAAGASTPPVIIKEAVKYMSEIENENNNQTFEEMLNDSIVTLHTGDVVKGTVIQVTNGEVAVDLGYKSDGIIPLSEITDNPNGDVANLVKPGDAIDVYVVRVNDGEGNVILSKKKIDSQKNLDFLEEAYNSKTPVKGKVVEVVKGGLIALMRSVRIFIPSSQISNRYVEDLTVFKGKEFNFNIIEFDKSKRRIVAGRKELATIEQNELKEKVYGSLTVGQRIEGTVNRIVNFGAFVDLGGVDGLIHISQLSWGRVKKVSDVLSEGDNVTVTVLDIDKEKGKISLSLKDINSDPWNRADEKYFAGEIVEGKVVRMVPFGAFVELEEGIDGLIHISQISARHVVKPEDELEIGQIVKVKITETDLANRKISLSKKDADGVLGDQEAEQSVEEDLIESAAEPVEDSVEAVNDAVALEAQSEDAGDASGNE